MPFSAQARARSSAAAGPHASHQTRSLFSIVAPQPLHVRGVDTLTDRGLGWRPEANLPAAWLAPVSGVVSRTSRPVPLTSIRATCSAYGAMSLAHWGMV